MYIVGGCVVLWVKDQSGRLQVIVIGVVDRCSVPRNLKSFTLQGLPASHANTGQG